MSLTINLKNKSVPFLYVYVLEGMGEKVFRTFGPDGGCGQGKESSCSFLSEGRPVTGSHSLR